ncbi:MAG TPA: DUF4296 domain-containing protein [Chitinophagaceae bacterium]
MRLTLFVMLICLFAACRSPNKMPNDIIGIDKMKLIVWDMIRAGALSENKFGRYPDSLKMKSIQMFQQVFAVHGITKDEFYKSYRYYEAHPDKNKILMDSVYAYANRQRQDLYKRMR